MSFRLSADTFAARIPLISPSTEATLLPAVSFPANSEKIFPTQTVLRKESLASLKGTFHSGHPNEVPPIMLLEMPTDQLLELIYTSSHEHPTQETEEYFSLYSWNTVLLLLNGSHRLATAFENNAGIKGTVANLWDLQSGKKYLDQSDGESVDREGIGIALTMFLRTLQNNIFSIEDLMLRGDLR